MESSIAIGILGMDVCSSKRSVDKRLDYVQMAVQGGFVETRLTRARNFWYQVSVPAD